MRIAQIAPLYESVPPKLYGGTERIVSYLTEELVAQGHDVTLFASGDSLTSAKLVPCVPTAIRLNPAIKDAYAYHLLMFDRVLRMAPEFDILHFHTDYHQFPIFRHLAGRVLTTLHGRLDLADLQPVYAEYQDMRVLSISDDQRKPLPVANWVGTIYHGLPENLLGMGDGSGGYLAFLGRISPEKRPDRAIEIALRSGVPLKMAAKVDAADQDYFDSRIKPLLDHPLIDFVGEINERQKASFLGNARALLFPIDWPEPFGLVMIEAMACGTPVIAWPSGSVKEVLDDGVSGLFVHSVEQAVDAVGKLPTLDRRAVRDTFERRFSARRMALDYVKLYQQSIDSSARIETMMHPAPFVPMGGRPLPGEAAPHAAVAARALMSPA